MEPLYLMACCCVPVPEWETAAGEGTTRPRSAFNANRAWGFFSPGQGRPPGVVTGSTTGRRRRSG